MKFFLMITWITGAILYAAADASSSAHDARLLAKGEKIAHRLCEEKRLPKLQAEADDVQIDQAITDSGACPPLGPDKLKALRAFLQAGVSHTDHRVQRIAVPQGAKCPVCGMFVSKYPKWAAQMIVDGKKHYFDGVKDMMKYYFFDGDFPYDRRKIEAMKVSDYYTLEPVDARNAYYVLGSNVYGPMGNELVPFKDEASAKNFLHDHKGERIVRFEEMSPKMVMALDGIELHD